MKPSFPQPVPRIERLIKGARSAKLTTSLPQAEENRFSCPLCLAVEAGQAAIALVSTKRASPIEQVLCPLETQAVTSGGPAAADNLAKHPEEAERQSLYESPF